MTKILVLRNKPIFKGLFIHLIGCEHDQDLGPSFSHVFEQVGHWSTYLEKWKKKNPNIVYTTLYYNAKIIQPVVLWFFKCYLNLPGMNSRPLASSDTLLKVSPLYHYPRSKHFKIYPSINIYNRMRANISLLGEKGNVGYIANRWNSTVKNCNPRPIKLLRITFRNGMEPDSIWDCVYAVSKAVERSSRPSRHAIASSIAHISVVFSIIDKLILWLHRLFN